MSLPSATPSTAECTELSWKESTSDGEKVVVVTEAEVQALQSILPAVFTAIPTGTSPEGFLRAVRSDAESVLSAYHAIRQFLQPLHLTLHAIDQQEKVLSAALEEDQKDGDDHGIKLHADRLVESIITGSDITILIGRVVGKDVVADEKSEQDPVSGLYLLLSRYCPIIWSQYHTLASFKLAARLGDSRAISVLSIYPDFDHTTIDPRTMNKDRHMSWTRMGDLITQASIAENFTLFQDRTDDGAVALNRLFTALILIGKLEGHNFGLLDTCPDLLRSENFPLGRKLFDAAYFLGIHTFQLANTSVEN